MQDISVLFGCGVVGEYSKNQMLINFIHPSDWVNIFIYLNYVGKKVFGIILIETVYKHGFKDIPQNFLFPALTTTVRILMMIMRIVAEQYDH